MRAPRLLPVALLLLARAPARADTVVLTNGKKIEDVVVSRQDDQVVVVNPWRSRHPDMTWEIPDKDRIPRAKVAEVVIEDPPLVEARRRAATPGLTPADHVALARFCEEHRLKEEAARQVELALAEDPTQADALELFGGAARWERRAHGDGDLDPALRALEHEYLALEDPEDLAAKLEALHDAGSRRPLEILERARRSARQPKGMREKVPLTLRSDQAPGATYCIVVPRSYDPLVPTPLVVGLHGGGRGGADESIVSGSGEQAMPFYRDLAERWGWIVVCPTALAAPWSHPKNEPWIDALLEEMRLLYNVDENRIYLTGHSMGGFGTWHWGPARAEVWAAISPCAGGGGPNGVDGKGLPVYIYHGSDDGIVGPDSDRAAARSLAGGRTPHDFVYTEIGGVGHGFPDWVRQDVFRFFAGRMKDRGRKRATGPLSSFDRKVTKEEIVAFGNPKALPEAGEEDADTKDLLEALERGGGAARDAATRLGERKDPKTAKAVARVLRSRKATVDVRVEACRALGLLGLPECIGPLERALRDEDYRVVEAAVEALGHTGLVEAAPALAKGIQALGSRFEDSVQGNQIPFREYEVRLGSLAVGLEAAGRIAAPEALLPVVEAEVVRRVLGRPEPLVVLGEEDPRFRDNPSQARLRLGEALAGCLGAWADPRGAALLVAVREAWATRQPALAARMERAREALEG